MKSVRTKIGLLEAPTDSDECSRASQMFRGCVVSCRARGLLCLGDCGLWPGLDFESRSGSGAGLACLVYLGFVGPAAWSHGSIEWSTMTRDDNLRNEMRRRQRRSPLHPQCSPPK